MLYTSKLNDNRDFQRLYRTGRYIASEYSVIYVRPNGRGYSRLGITAGKKIGGAVQRNRAKRLIRLALSRSEMKLPVGVDIVVVARKRLTEIKSDEYCRYFERKAAGAINAAAAKMLSETPKRGKK